MSNDRSAAVDKTVIEQGGACDCADAEDLLDKINPRQDLWRPDPSTWIFRGHGLDWPLRAKGHRRDEDVFGEFGLPRPAESDWNTYIAVQERLLEAFEAAVDRAGLPIPTLPPTIKQAFTYRVLIQGEAEPRALPLVALAQHLGLPTALLDWSRHASVAAYFAAAWTPRCKTDSSEGTMVVWALRSDFLKLDELVRLQRLTLETAPRASNPNLHAQAGLFTWLHAELHGTTLDEEVQTLWKSYNEQPSASPFSMPLMRRLTLPRCHAPKLLRLLSHEGVDGSTMFPGYDGVVKAMKERARWDK